MTSWLPFLHSNILDLEGKTLFHLQLEVCIPGLVLNETRQDGTGGHFLNWRDHDSTEFFWSCFSGTSGKKMGKNEMRRDYSIPIGFNQQYDAHRESLGEY